MPSQSSSEVLRPVSCFGAPHGALFPARGARQGVILLAAPCTKLHQFAPRHRGFARGASASMTDGRAAMSTEHRELTLLTGAEQFLAEARTRDQVKELCDKAQAARIYAKKGDCSKEIGFWS